MSSAIKIYITKIDGKWYAFKGNSQTNQVTGIGRDVPPKSSGCSAYIARWTDTGIKYVASSSSSRAAAVRKAKLAAEKSMREYGGEV